MPTHVLLVEGTTTDGAGVLKSRFTVVPHALEVTTAGGPVTAQVPVLEHAGHWGLVFGEQQRPPTHPAPHWESDVHREPGACTATHVAPFR